MEQIKTICDGCGMEIPEHQHHSHSEISTNDPTVDDVHTDLCWECIIHAVGEYLRVRDRALRTGCKACKGTGMVTVVKGNHDVKCEKCRW